MERVNPTTGQPWKYGEIGLDGRIFLAYRRKSRINKDGTYQMNWLSPESWKKTYGVLQTDYQGNI